MTGSAAELAERPPLRVVADSPVVDLEAAQDAASAFLRALGLRTDDESLLETPRRMATAYAEMLTPREFDLTTFPNDAGYDELVLARSIPLRSVCEHHMLPFIGVAHVGYLPGARILGLSKMARVVEMFACRPQVQERLTTQVAQWLRQSLDPRGVGVVVEAEHLCMTMRGVKKPGALTVTSAVRGIFEHDAAARAEAMAFIRSGV